MAKNKPKTTKYILPGCFRIILSVVFLAVMAIIFTYFIEYRHRMSDSAMTWEWITSHGLVFWYSCLVIFLILSLIVSIFWRTFFGTGVTFAMISIITYISAEKYKVRQAPLLPEDFQMVGNMGEVASFVDAWGIVRLVIGVIFILVGSGLLEYYVRRFLGRKSRSLPWWQRWSMIPRVTFALLSAVCLLLTTNFLVHHQQHGDQDVEWLQTSLIGWGQTENYLKNGWLIGFVYNLGRLEMPVPEGYDATAIAEIKTTYLQKQAEDDDHEALSEIVDNIIVVLDETFYDPELLTTLYPHSGGDPLPNLRKIFQKYPSGYMYSPEYGGGTANIEFEVLTGLSNYWANTTQYINTVPKLPSLQSIVSWALESGFSTTAIHAYDGSVYKRDIVYPKIGYEKFIDVNGMSHHEYENSVGQMSDSAVYKEIMDVLNDGKAKHMVGVVTMQNHTPYDSAHYNKLDYKITGVFPNEQLENSIQSLHNADQYLIDFLTEIDKLDEKTVVLWFGDHASGVINAYVTSEKKADHDLAHLTPYFIYTNFELENELSTVSEVKKINQKLGLQITTKHVDLPTTTPNCLANTLYNLLEVKKPTLMYLLDEVCTTEPILARAYLESKAPANTEALRAYELLNYDLLTGKRYWYEN